MTALPASGTGKIPHQGGNRSSRLSLYFYSTRTGGFGLRDLWVASRPTLDGKFVAPKNLAPLYGNTDDHLPWISDDERTILFSTTRNGYLARLYIAERATKADAFSLPVPVGGLSTTTSREDRAALANNGQTLHYVSDRPGGAGDKDI